MSIPLDQIAAAVTARMPFAEALFETLAVATHDGGGVTRPAWSPADQYSSIFACAGIPSAMVLIRNQHGSHNAAEAMEMPDFDLGTQILATTLLDLA